MLLAGTEGLIKNINTPAVHDKSTKELDDSESSSVGSNLKNCASMLKESQVSLTLSIHPLLFSANLAPITGRFLKRIRRVLGGPSTLSRGQLHHPFVYLFSYYFSQIFSLVYWINDFHERPSRWLSTKAVHLSFFLSNKNLHSFRLFHAMECS